MMLYTFLLTRLMWSGIQENFEQCGKARSPYREPRREGPMPRRRATEFFARQIRGFSCLHDGSPGVLNKNAFRQPCAAGSFSAANPARRSRQNVQK